MQKSFFTFFIFCIIIIWYYVTSNITMTKLTNYLKDNNCKVYVNAVNCGYCLQQLKFFGNMLHNVEVIHCDDSKNIRECSNLKALPAWSNGNQIKYGARLNLESFDIF